MEEEMTLDLREIFDIVKKKMDNNNYYIILNINNRYTKLFCFASNL